MANNGMKIELAHSFPVESDYHDLLNALLEEDKEAKLIQYEDFCQSSNVVAAYDQGKLVGLGSVAKQLCSSSFEEGQPCRIAVLRQYNRRGVGGYLRKLLSVRSN